MTVLGIALLITVIGLSALLNVRVKQRAAGMTEATVTADFYAQSLIDQALFALTSNPNWRTTYASGTWVPAAAEAGVSLSFKLVDEQDGNLANDQMQPVRVYGQATVGDALRIYSVLVKPTRPANLLTNGDLENGTTGWFGSNCTIEARTDVPHAGAQYIHAHNRSISSAGPGQSILSAIQSGATYQFEIWVRMSTGSGNVIPVMQTTSSASGTQWSYGSTTTVGTSWTKLTSSFTPSWSGTLTSANVYVITQSGTTAFKIDDAGLTELRSDSPLPPVRGSWRREVLP